MTDLELIFTMLGEAATTEIARNKDAQGFIPNKRAAHEGGTVAGSHVASLKPNRAARSSPAKTISRNKP